MAIGRHIGARPGLLIVVILLPLAMCLAGCNQQKSTATGRPLTNSAALKTVVWAKKLSGIYYCRDSALFGIGPGSYMKQAKALENGYQPQFGTYCAEPKTSKPVDQTKSRGITSFFTR